MLSRRAAASRIPLLRRHRPPSTPATPRPFTQKSQLLLVARHTLRPQLPFLSQSSFSRRLSPLDQHVLRLLSTETRTYVKDQAYLAARWTLIGWTFLALAGIATFGFQIEQDERNQPTPAEWSFRTRNWLRGARFESEDRGGVGVVDWARAGTAYLAALRRLEEGKDSQGVVAQEGGEGIMIPDVGSAGLDIEAKSWQWRAGYFEVLMGCATAAEQLDSMVLDKTRGFVFPKEVVIGPSNPDPRPVAAYMSAAPREENVGRAFDPPETFYMRVLTGRGFTTKQRLEAAWKYANWLEFEGANESAEEMYKWAVDIALAPLPSAASVIDPKTFVLKTTSGKTGATPEYGVATTNVLEATTALAVHRARSGDVSSALPTLLSVLRARRSAPVAPTSHSSDQNQSSLSGPAKNETGSDLDAAVSFITNFFRSPTFPDAPPSGDTPLLLPSTQPTCEDSELMLYIGEILFATSSSPAEGLGWTRQAVAIAEANLEQSKTRTSAALLSEDDRRRCKQCLRTGVSNWETMLAQLAERSAGPVVREGGRDAGWFEWRGWFGSGGGFKGRVLDGAHAGMLDQELKQVASMKERIAREVMDEDLYKNRGAGGGVWIG